MPLPITILPCDRRMEYASRHLEKKGGKICSSWAEIPDSGYLICGIPFTKNGQKVNTAITDPLSIRDFLGILTPSHILIGGSLPMQVITYCTHHGIKYYDVMTSSDFAAKNARLTAEGLLIPLLSHTSFSIYDCETLLIGYGRCGREIADILQPFARELYIYDVDPHAAKAARSRHFKTISEKELQNRTHKVHHVNTIINTSPVNPFPIHLWQTFPEDCVILNIASFSLRLPFPCSEHVFDCPGIPGKYAPKTAGSLIAREICEHFRL